MALASYTIGSIPFGFIIAKAKGFDLRQLGSGNIGSTNIYRALGFRIALLVFLLDAGKGFLGTRMVPMLGPDTFHVTYLRFICAVGVILGSVASIFMRLKGGKGVATGAGVFLGLAPLATAVSIGIWAGLLAIWRYVSLGSLAAAAALPVLVAVFGPSEYSRDPVFYLALVVAVIVFVRHRSNIKRLVQGGEHRVGRLRTPGPDSSGIACPGEAPRKADGSLGSNGAASGARRNGEEKP